MTPHYADDAVIDAAVEAAARVLNTWQDHQPWAEWDGKFSHSSPTLRLALTAALPHLTQKAAE